MLTIYSHIINIPGHIHFAQSSSFRHLGTFFSFSPYLASRNFTSSAVSVGCFMAMVGAKFFGWKLGRCTTRRTDFLSPCLRRRICARRNGQYLYSFGTLTGSACHFLVRLLYLRAYLKLPSLVVAWGLNTCILWSIAAKVTLATKTRYVANWNKPGK